MSEWKAKQLSMNWYEIKKKKYYFDVYYCPENDKIQIGTFKTDEELFPFPIPTWKSLTRQLLWNTSAAYVYALLESLIEEQANIDELWKELMTIDWRKKVSSDKTWIRFSGGSEK